MDWKFILLILFFQLFATICVSNMQELFNFVSDTSVLLIPVSKLHKVNHVDKYNFLYRILIILSIFLMGLTNVILIESLTTFPLGWIASSIVVLIAENCCCCLNECFPRIFAKPRHDQNVYETLHDSKALPIGIFVWAIFSYFLLVYVMNYVYQYGYV
jgi:hypothetical protein